uniref:Uncharacterized protein n=1 Tax=Sphaerodactylus townsendi TaxID=933632 RepID=A0ACB8GEV5_9SAUR
MMHAALYQSDHLGVVKMLVALCGLSPRGSISEHFQVMWMGAQLASCGWEPNLHHVDGSPTCIMWTGAQLASCGREPNLHHVDGSPTCIMWTGAQLASCGREPNLHHVDGSPTSATKGGSRGQTV